MSRVRKSRKSKVTKTLGKVGVILVLVGSLYASTGRNLKSDIQDIKLRLSMLNKPKQETVVEMPKQDTIEIVDELNDEESFEEVQVEVDRSDYPEFTSLPTTNNESSELLDQGYDFMNIDFDGIHEQYSQNVNSWFVIDGEISVPIVQDKTKEYDYYLHHNIYDEEEKAGAVFEDVDNASFDQDISEYDDISYIYGHHMKSGRMLAPIDKFTRQSFYDKHKFGVLYTPEGVYKVEFFACVIIPGNEDLDNSQKYVKTNFISEETYNDYIAYLKEYSLIETDVNVSFGDKIFGCITCNYSEDNARCLLLGKLVKQKTNNYAENLGR